MISRYGQSLNVRDKSSAFWMKGSVFSFVWVTVRGYISSCGTALSFFIYLLPDLPLILQYSGSAFTFTLPREYIPSLWIILEGVLANSHVFLLCC